MSPRIPTKNGYEFFEVTSAFQKAIRRGDERHALYWMTELYNSSKGEYVWKRIKVMVSEDIGLAEPHMPAQIHALYESYKAVANDKHLSGRLMLVHAVLLLVRAKKSRLVDWALCNEFNRNGNDPEHHLAIPDYAYDKHTQKGKAMGRGMDHFYKEGAKLMNHAPQNGEKFYEEQSATSWGWVKKQEQAEPVAPEIPGLFQ